MYCTYNNDTLFSAIYGKLYNWFAAVLLAPKGYHLMSSAEWTQIQTFLGGSTVAGGKMKAQFGGFNNGFSSNESGLSATSGGVRDTSGGFSNPGVYFRSSDSSNNVYRILSSDTLLTNMALEKRYGTSIIYARNTPYGDQTRTIELDWLTTNFATGTNIDVIIPWGYKVTDILCDSETNISGLKAELRSSSNALLATLITSETVTAGTIADINTDNVKQAKTYTDNIVRLNGVKVDIANRMKFTIEISKI